MTFTPHRRSAAVLVHSINASLARHWKREAAMRGDVGTVTHPLAPQPASNPAKQVG